MTALSTFAGPAHAAGVAARLLPVVPVEGAPLEVRIEVQDPHGVVATVRVERRDPGGTWTSTSARHHQDGLWHATLPPPRGRTVELRAELLGAYGGVISRLGDPPARYAVETPASARALADRFSSRPPPRRVFAARIGFAARANDRARLRAALGVARPMGARDEITGGVTVGPAFAPPTGLEGDAPVALGFELGWRRHVRPPDDAGWSAFVEGVSELGLRLPGLDGGVGLRVGASTRVGPATSVEWTAGGGVVLRAVDDRSARDLVFQGELRASVSFDAEAR